MRAGSVYNLIKKELVSLRVDANALATNVNALLQAQRVASSAQAQVDAVAEELRGVQKASAKLEARVAAHDAALADLDARRLADVASLQRVRMPLYG